MSEQRLQGKSSKITCTEGLGYKSWIQVLDTSPDTVITEHTNVLAPSGRIASKRDAVVSSRREADGHRAGSDWNAIVKLQHGDVIVPERLFTFVFVMDNELTHVKRLLLGVWCKPIELADYDAVVPRIVVSVSTTTSRWVRVFKIQLNGWKTFL